ncbi:MAG: ATP-binding protein [Acidobacteria bacterium]|nr:ATP-binding protein [Acidobacteriota bacterium]
MPETLGSPTSLRLSAPASAAPPPPRRRRPFRDNPLLLLLGILALIGVLSFTMTLANRSSGLAPDFLSEFVLYSLSVVDLTMLVALVFVLARSVIKLLVERKRGLPFARFRAKLVTVLLAMTLVPAVLVLLVGSQLIFNSVDRWFNAPMDEILDSAQRIASDYYHDRQRQVSGEASRLARSLAAADLASPDVRLLRDAIAPPVSGQQLTLVEVYRVQRGPEAETRVVPVVDVASASMSAVANRASSDRLATRAAGGQPDVWIREPLEGGGELIRAAAVVRKADGAAVGVVVATVHLTGELALRARRMTKAYESYTQLKVLKRPLTGVYLSFFLMVTLMVLVSATWMGLYLAKRITRPVQLLAAAAREIGAGHFEHRVERETADEFGSLVDAFNTMADELATSRLQLDRSTIDLQQKHAEVEERRRFTEAVLDRVATGVITIDARGRIGTVNPAAVRLLGLGATVIGQPASAVFGHGDLLPLSTLATATYAPGKEWPAQEIALVRDGREVQLAVAATPLQADGGPLEGRVLVLDDITPLIRAQKVAAWREVARRLAHEIKNPLTPIQLSAQRLQRQFAAAPDHVRAFVDECTGTIVGEVDSLKALVDEFSQFARMPAPRRVPTDLHDVLLGTLALYDGLFQSVKIETLFAVSLPRVRLDPDQIRRVVINLLDNAIEAFNQRGQIVVETHHDAGSGVVRIVIADDGPGIAAEERDKLFMPYFSTKKRGSGLGLAIVRRIVAEHGGTVEAGPNEPRGSRFTIELPCESREGGTEGTAP